MRKLIFLLLFVAVATFAQSQTVVLERVEPAKLEAALKGCEKSSAKYRDQSRQVWPCYLSADKTTTFYVRRVLVASDVFRYEFILLEKDGQTYAGG